MDYGYSRQLQGEVPREAIAGAPFILREEGSGTRALFEAVMQAFAVQGVRFSRTFRVVYHQNKDLTPTDVCQRMSHFFSQKGLTGIVDVDMVYMQQKRDGFDLSHSKIS